MQANLNSLAIVALGLALVSGYVRLQRRIYQLDRDILKCNTDRMTDMVVTVRREDTLKEMVETLRGRVNNTEKKLTRYLDIDNPFNVTVKGDSDQEEEEGKVHGDDV